MEEKLKEELFYILRDNGDGFDSFRAHEKCDEIISFFDRTTEQKDDRCPKCGGDGNIKKTGGFYLKCPTCNGTGRVLLV